MTTAVAGSPINPPKPKLVSWKHEEGEQKQRQTSYSVVTGIGVVEKHLRHIIKTKMIRVSEFFKDFDPLRSGYITNQQFRRCLDEHLGLVISDGDYQFLIQKYGQEKEGKMNYKAFEKAMENAFDPLVLDGQPGSQLQHSQSTPLPSQYMLTENQFNFTNNILVRCHDYYKCRGINVKNSYSDFDRHNRGLITETQFHRSFPGPADVTPDEVAALAQRYQDLSSGLYNYVRFHEEVMAIGENGVNETYGPPQSPKLKAPSSQTVDQILDRIRDIIYRNGIRTTEFFRDHDKRRCRLITENQFVCGLCLCCERVVSLSREEIQKIVDHFKNPEGKVKYMEFCNLMENAYNESALEKKPTANVYRPLQGHLIKPLNSLKSPNDEAKLLDIIARLKSEVKLRRLILLPYFQDFDTNKGYTRGVTKPQFERILHFLSLNVSSSEVKLLESKFEAANGIDVNYVAFIQSIDEEYTGQVMEEENTTLKESYCASTSKKSSTAPSSHSLSPEEIDMLISRLREHIKSNRIRASEHFQDFDPLRCNSIAASRFRQGLTNIGKPYLTDDEFKALCELYADPKVKGFVMWRKFVSQMDDPELASAVSIPKPISFASLRVGAIDFQKMASQEEMTILENVLRRLREYVQLRRVLIKPIFNDFDRHHIGYVTKSQFRQSLYYLGMTATEEELTLMEICFCDSCGFRYPQFLEELQPPDFPENKYKIRLTQMEEKKKLAETLPAIEPASLQEVMEKIKAKVCKERMRISDFMKDYDKLRRGYVTSTIFFRALDLCGFKFNEAESLVLRKRYSTRKDPNFVDYVTFCDEIESIFTTKNLEKMPTADVEVFVPPVEIGTVPLVPEEEEKFDIIMNKVAEKVYKRNILLFPLFEDYDRLHIGSVTKSQFQRVLSELELNSLITGSEYNIIFHKFEQNVGGRLDVNYIAFCDTCYSYAEAQAKPKD